MNEPKSFEDLVEHFVAKHPQFKGKKIATTPIYAVNKVTGSFTAFDKVEIITGEETADYALCEIKPFVKLTNCWVNTKIFPVSLRYKDRDKLVDIAYGSLYMGNYQLFLHKKEAAQYAINILQKKKKKIDENIEKLFNII